MIDYVKGRIAELNPAVCVIETAGVGFGINISLNTYQQLQGADSALLYIYESIREDAFQLFGFTTRTEREMFLLLISVSGIGAGTARMILSTYAGDELADIIAREDVNAIKRVKGIGLKSAQRIIVDLKDKVQQIGRADGTAATATAARDERYDEAVAALVALGFAQAPSAKTVDKIVHDNPDIAVGAIIKLALKAL